MNVPAYAVLPLVRAALARGQCVRMTAQGTSMWPCIGDGDLIELTPPHEPPSRGDVVLAEAAPARFVVHRVTKVCGASAWLRGDAQTRSEGPIAITAVLGTVTHVIHRGRARMLARGMWRWVGLLCMYSRPLPAWAGRARIRLWQAASRMLACLQRRAFVRIILQWSCPPVAIRAATAADRECVAAWLALPGLADLPEAAAPADYVAAHGAQLLGFVRLLQHTAADAPRTGWWLYSLTVRARFRGMGIGERLVRHALSMAAAAGAPMVMLTVFEDNRAACALYAKLGFTPAHCPAVAAQLADDVARHGRRRILLCKSLP